MQSPFKDGFTTIHLNTFPADRVPCFFFEILLCWFWRHRSSAFALLWQIRVLAWPIMHLFCRFKASRFFWGVFDEERLCINIPARKPSPQGRHLLSSPVVTPPLSIFHLHSQLFFATLFPPFHLSLLPLFLYPFFVTLLFYFVVPLLPLHVLVQYWVNAGHTQAFAVWYVMHFMVHPPPLPDYEVLLLFALLHWGVRLQVQDMFISSNWQSWTGVLCVQLR